MRTFVDTQQGIFSPSLLHGLLFLPLSFKNILHSFLIPHSQTTYIIFFPHSWTFTILSSLPLSFMDIQHYLLSHGHPAFSLNPSFMDRLTLYSFYNPRHLTFHLPPSFKHIQHSLFLLPNSLNSNILLYYFIIHGNLQATFRLFLLSVNLHEFLT